MEGTIELEFNNPDTADIVEEGGSFNDERDGGKRKHKGLDFNSTRRSHIKASEDGVVVKSEKKEGKGYGETVIIDHTPEATEEQRHIYTLYGHLYKRLVSVGKKVKQGDIIAESGNTGTWQNIYCSDNGAYPVVETKAYKECQASEVKKIEDKGETVEEDKVYERCKGIKRYRTTSGFHLHFEVIDTIKDGEKETSSSGIKLKWEKNGNMDFEKTLKIISVLQRL